MTIESDAARLREGAAAIRQMFASCPVVMNAIAEGLDSDAARLDRGEPVTALAESLDLADTFCVEVQER